ncbi:MAG: ATP-binding protein [Sideroxydans sp.]|nr:ATP-binding protein [Sideroxydans sp.]
MDISIKDFRGVANLSATIDGILLVAGPNGAGKSSACTAIAACLTGDLLPFQGVTKAKASLLVRDGGASASATLTGPDGGAVVTWPDCQRAEKGKAPWASPVAAGLVNTLAMGTKERAKWLIGLIGALPDENAMMEACEALDVYRADAESSWKAIAARGWDAAHAEAKEQGAKYKGQWERVTGARYGSAKAASWRPEGWRSGIDALGLDELTRSAETAAARYDEVRRAGLVGETKRADYQTALTRRQAALSTLDHAKGEVLATQGAVDRARADRAKFGPTADKVWECPCCGKNVALIEGDLCELPADAADPNDIATADNAVRNNEDLHRRESARLAAIEDAIKAGDAAEKAIAGLPPIPDAEDLARIKTAADEAGQMLRMKRQVAEAGELHEKITRQVEIVKLLAEDGLRQTALVAALSGFAADLAEITHAAGWRPVYVDADMSLSYGGRPVSLCSAGEQYRVQCVLQIAAARRDGSALVVLDGADILDKPGRNGLMKALAGMNAVIGMTMRAEEVPAKLLASGRAVWVGDEPMQVAA